MYKGLSDEELSKYREVLYSGDSDYDCKLTINGTLIPAEQISTIKKSSPIIDTSSDTGKTFHIGTFISEQLTVKFKNLDGLNLENNPPVYLEIGLKVDETYKYIPIGYFNVDDLSENYYSTCEVTLLDYAVKFKPNIDISQFFNDEGKITAEELLKAICKYFNVELGSYPYTNRNKEISAYDSTLSGKYYISYLAELMGGNAKINRDGKLDIIALRERDVEELENLTGEDTSIDDNALNLCSLNFYGNSTQEGTPTPDYPSEIESVEEINEVIENNKFNISNIEQGAISGISSKTFEQCKSSSTTRIRNTNLIQLNKADKYKIKFNSDIYNVAVQAFDENEIYFETTNTNSWKSATFNITGIPYIGAMIKRIDGNNITVDEIENVNLIITSESQTITIPLQKPFRSVNGTRDTFEYKDGKWYEVHNILDYDISANAYNITWTKDKALTNSNEFYTDEIINSSSDKCLSNYFTYSTADDIENVDKEGITIINNKQIALRISNKTITSISKLQNYLQKQNIEFYYISSTPEYIQCTDEQVEILNQIQDLDLYEGVNYIYSNDEVKAGYELQYEKYSTTKDKVIIDVPSGKKFEVNSKYKLQRICYDNGIQKFEYGGNVITVSELPTEDISTTAIYYNTSDMKYYKYDGTNWSEYEMNNTLYLRNDNLFITETSDVENIYKKNNGFEMDCVTAEHRGDLTLDCYDVVTFRNEDEDYYCYYDNNITFNGTATATVKVNIPIQTVEETTNIQETSTENKVRRIKTKVDQTEASLEILSEEVETNYVKTADFTVKSSEIKAEAKSETTNTILNLLNNDYLKADQVNTLVNGNTEEIATIKKSLEATVTDSQMKIAIQTAINGGVSYLKNTMFTIDENGMAIATDTDEFNALYNNKGMYLYSFTELIARFDVDGATLKNLKVEGEIETGNLRIMDVTVDSVNHTYIHWIGG